MIRYIIRRLLISIPILLIGSFACYVLVASAGNPLAEMRFRPGRQADRHQVQRQQDVAIGGIAWRRQGHAVAGIEGGKKAQQERA